MFTLNQVSIKSSSGKSTCFAAELNIDGHVFDNIFKVVNGVVCAAIDVDASSLQSRSKLVVNGKIRIASDKVECGYKEFFVSTKNTTAIVDASTLKVILAIDTSNNN